MANKYEFKIEEIQSVRIISLDECNFTVKWDRVVDDDGIPVRSFVESYIADYDKSKEEEGKIGVICPICGSFVFIDKDKTEDESFDSSFDLNHCTENDMIYYSEDELIEMIYSYMNPDEFSGCMIYINNVLIQ